MKYEYEPHHVITTKTIPWPRCRWCGLVYLKNEFTSFCIKVGCNNRYHPDFKRYTGKR